MSRRRALPLLAVLASCCASPTRPPAPASPSAPAAPATKPPAPKSARRAFTVEYRRAADAFQIIDDVSSWWPDKNDPEYRQAWEKRFGLSPSDAQRFSRWADVRKRHRPAESESSELLVGREKPVDRVAAIFRRERELERALSRASEELGAADAGVLRETFGAFQPQLDQLLDESRAFADVARALQTKLDDPRVGAFVERVAGFYGVSELPTFTVLLVWWPPVEATSASPSGDVLLLKYHPVQHLDSARRDIDVPVHEVVHFVSMRQSAEQKLAVSRAFASKCSVPEGLPPAHVLEEPLAVAQQKLLAAEIDPRAFDRESSWYGSPWVSALAKLIFEPVRESYAREGKLDEQLARTLGRSCRELAAVGKQLAR